MKKLVVVLSLILALLALSGLAFANTPGKHSVSLTWTELNCPTCTFNLYRGTAAGVCSGTPTPYQTGLTTTSFNDLNVALGTTYTYAVSAVNPGMGGESACSSEVQVSVPNITTPVPQGLSGSSQ